MIEEPSTRPPIATAPLTVALLALNDSAHLGLAVAEWKTVLEARQRPFEILLVVSEPAADSPERFDELAAQSPFLRVLRAKDLGEALRRSVEAAANPLFLYVEAADEYQPADLAGFLEAIDLVDIVSGYRELPPGAGLGWRYAAFRWLVRFLFGVRLRDVNCAFKLFRRDVFARIPIQSSGDFTHAEIVAKANFLGSLMTEVPVRYRPAATATDGSGRVASRPWLSDARLVFRDPRFAPSAAEGTGRQEGDGSKVGGGETPIAFG